MIKKHLPHILIVLTITLFLASLPAFASEFNINQYCPINSPFCETTTNRADAATSTINLLQILSRGLLYFAAPVAVIIIVIAGLKMSATSSTPESLETSKKTLIWALAGLAIVILSYSIVRIVISFTIKAAG
ncbi:hypothetical protein CVV38_04220 [Candidatus Peregrinibacteria bacterium HGW-Peregrinibacteria-1]|jgi:hypothetical protein|nr:MAG: hypothetical protein CVV38_04220 [Candidatus Peregrinibacteria bacterium HGW-Peregrinibacteria-1]